MRPTIPPCALLLALAVAACGAEADGTVSPGFDTQITMDAIASDVVIPADTTATDTAPASDTSAPADAEPSDTRQPDGDVGAPSTVKQDPDFLVPGGVADRRHVAASGSQIAWVERTSPEATPRLVVWDVTAPELAPASFDVPNLLAPRELALGEGFLVYVDDRYGDPDVFALDLAAGVELPVVTEPGAQDAPTIARASVAWSDCRRCVSGDGGDNRDVYRLELPAGLEVAVTLDDTADRRPVFGTLADGTLGLAWIRGAATLRALAEGGGLDVSWTMAAPVDAVALTDGVLAWRPQPVIINPDSMMPSDLFLTSAATGETEAATFHAELAPALPSAPRAATGRIAWLESPPDDAGVTLIRVITALDRAVVIDASAPSPARSLALGPGHLAVTAARADNDGLDDVWVLPLP